jgi:hypothetical protein
MGDLVGVRPKRDSMHHSSKEKRQVDGKLTLSSPARLNRPERGQGRPAAVRTFGEIQNSKTRTARARFRNLDAKGEQRG